MSTQPSMFISYCMFSPHGIAMPKGLYFTAVVFSFFLLSFFYSTPNRCGHWTDLNQTWTHIHLWLLFEKLGTNSIVPRASIHHGLGAKTLFGPTLKFERTYLCNGTRHQQSERNSSIYRDSPTCLQNWWTLVHKGLRTIGEFLPNPLIFRIVRHCQLYCMDVI